MGILKETESDIESEVYRLATAKMISKQLEAADCVFCKARRRSLYEQAVSLPKPRFWPKHLELPLYLAAQTDEELEVYLQVLECDVT